MSMESASFDFHGALFEAQHKYFSSFYFLFYGNLYYDWCRDRCIQPWQAQVIASQYCCTLEEKSSRMVMQLFCACSSVCIVGDCFLLMKSVFLCYLLPPVPISSGLFSSNLKSKNRIGYLFCARLPSRHKACIRGGNFLLPFLYDCCLKLIYFTTHYSYRPQCTGSRRSIGLQKGFCLHP